MNKVGVVAIALAAIACDRGPMQPTKDDPSKRSGPVMDFSDKKRKQHDVEVDRIKFSIEIPEGLPKAHPIDWEDETPQYDHAPKVFLQTIEMSRVPDLDKAKYHATLDARTKTWLRSEQRPDGFAVTTQEPDKSKIEAVTYRAAGDRYVKCKATQSSGEGALPNVDRIRQMLEAICDSVKLAGAAAPAAPAGSGAAPPP